MGMFINSKCFIKVKCFNGKTKQLSLTNYYYTIAWTSYHLFFLNGFHLIFKTKGIFVFQ